MSVDDRLREAFRETDRSWDGDVPDALSALTARQRRESVVRRGAAAALVAAAAVAAVAVAVSQRAEQDSSPTDHPPPTPSSTAGVGAEPNPLDGTWVSEPVTRADVRRAARLAGDPADAEALLAGVPGTPFRVVLYIDGDRSSIHAAVRVAGQPEATVDEENLTVSSDSLVMRPRFGEGEGENVHTWVLDNGSLRITFVSTTEGETEGVPGEAWQRLFYDAAAFAPGT
jgi:hypothetical protein